MYGSSQFPDASSHFPGASAMSYTAASQAALGIGHPPDRYAYDDGGMGAAPSVWALPPAPRLPTRQASAGWNFDPFFSAGHFLQQTTHYDLVGQAIRRAEANRAAEEMGMPPVSMHPHQPAVQSNADWYSQPAAPAGAMATYAHQHRDYAQAPVAQHPAAQPAYDVGYPPRSFAFPAGQRQAHPHAVATAWPHASQAAYQPPAPPTHFDQPFGPGFGYDRPLMDRTGTHFSSAPYPPATGHLSTYHEDARLGGGVPSTRQYDGYYAGGGDYGWDQAAGGDGNHRDYVEQDANGQYDDMYAADLVFHPETKIMPTPAPPPSAEAAPAPSAPAPPSPGTLDRSAVPLCGFGVEMVWAICAAMLDGSAVVSPDHGHSSAMSSTPYDSPHTLSTPAASADHSPSQLGRRATSAHRSRPSDQLGVGLMHKLAISALSTPFESAVPRSRSGQPTPDGGFSSPVSSNDGSEPGTPPSASKDERGGRYSMSSMSSAKGLGLDGLSVDMGPRSSSLGARSESIERSGAVLRLVSPSWQWDVAGQRFPSLVSQLPAEGAHDISLRLWNAKKESFLSSDLTWGAPRDVEPSPAFRHFAHQVLAQTLLSPTALLAAMLYVARLPGALETARPAAAEQMLSALFSQPAAAPFKLLTLGLMVANKHLDDNTFLNKTWAEVTGIPLKELSMLESHFLLLLSYDVVIPDHVWKEWLRRVRKREVGRLDKVTGVIGDRSWRAITSPSPAGTIGSEGWTQEQRRLIDSIDTMLQAVSAPPPTLSSSSHHHYRHYYSRHHRQTSPRALGLSSAHHQSLPSSSSGFFLPLAATYDIDLDEDGPLRPTAQPRRTPYSFYSPPAA